MLLFFASLITVFLLVFQQQNVTHKLYMWAVITSFGITLGQVFVIRGISIDSSYFNVMSMMGGGALGVVLSMLAHERLVKFYGRNTGKLSS